jgi:hypothetical protein
LNVKFFAISVILTVASPVFAGTTFGMPNCSRWFNATTVEKYQNRAWLLGWLSGVSHTLYGLTAGSVTRSDTLGKLDSTDEAYFFVDKFCSTNPRETVAAAAGELMADLISKKNKK